MPLILPTGEADTRVSMNLTPAYNSYHALVGPSLKKNTPLWWHTYAISALQRLRQRTAHELRPKLNFKQDCPGSKKNEEQKEDRYKGTSSCEATVDGAWRRVKRTE